MFGSRGARLCDQPAGRYARLAYRFDLRFAGLARLVVLVALAALSGMTRADYSFTDYPEDICATESIYLDGVSPTVQGVTGSGITYTVAQSQGQNSYNGRYVGVSAQHATLSVRFDKPIAAVGAMLVVSGYGSYVASGDAEQSGLYVSESGYRGVVASPGSIYEVTFATNNGPIHALRIDIRPLPLAANDRIQVFTNSDKIYDSGTLLRNDLHSEAAVLVSAPQHAAKFELLDDGSFKYQPEKNFAGIDTFSYRSANGLGASLSSPATVEIEVLPVNCPPEFLKGPDLIAESDAGLQSYTAWATQITPGTETEGPQNLTWEVTTDRPDLFLLAPALDLDGTLTFQPAPFKSGVASVTARLRDDGGLENGGVDTSEDQTFLITIKPRSHAPVIEQIMDCAVRGGDALILSARASLMDAETAVVYSLDKAPSGATIDPLSGQIIWRPSAQQAGQMPQFVVRATSSNADALTTTMSFHVEVLETARPPEIIPVEDIFGQPGARVTAKVAAKSGGNMRYFLASDVTGAMLNPTTGQFRWIPSTSDAGKVITFAVTAVDLTKPGLCAMETFAVHVGEMLASRPKSAGKSLIAKPKTLETKGQAAMKFATKPRKK